MNSRKNTYILHRHRWLLYLFAAKSPWSVMMFMLPLIAGWFYWNATALLSVQWPVISGLLFLGFLYWTLVEYLIHRFYFHFRGKSRFAKEVVGAFHLYHHETPSDLSVINSGWLTAFVGSFFHFFILQVLTLQHTEFSVWILIGSMTTYIFYEWVHHLVHQKKFERGLFRYLQEFHLTHHLIANKNFGQISPIWDYVFGTQTPNRAVDSNAFFQSFIKDLRGAQK